MRRELQFDKVSEITRVALNQIEHRGGKLGKLFQHKRHIKQYL